MDEYLQNIPDSELISITRDFLIENGILDQPIQRRKGNTYYFDKNEIYSLDNEGQMQHFSIQAFGLKLRPGLKLECR